MRIFEIITEGAIQDPEGWRDVQLNYGDDPKMLDMIKRAAMMPKITSWDQAVDKASAMMQQQTRQKSGKQGAPKRDFAINTRDGDNALRPGSEVRKDQQQADRKRGAQLGNQNARKNSGGDILKGLNRVKDVMTKGTLGDVGTAASVGSDIAKDAFTGLDNIAQTKDPKSMGKVFGD